MSKPMETQAGKDRLIYDPATDAVHVLNSTAQAILSGLREGLTRDQIAAKLRADFALAPEHPLEAEVDATILKLQELKLV